MTKKLIVLLSALPLLAACTAANTLTLERRLQNPLYAEYYFDDLVQRMVNITVYKDQETNQELVADEARMAIVEDTRRDALAKARQAADLQDEGLKGTFVPVNEYTQGEVLVLGDTIHFGPEFDAAPGPSLAIYFSEAVDPRNVVFPDDTAVKIAMLENNYGANSQKIGEIENVERFRSVVLWDTALARVYGFAQVSKYNE